MGKHYTEHEVERIVADAVQPLLQRIVQLEALRAQLHDRPLSSLIEV